jgi:hypothetical protein
MNVELMEPEVRFLQMLLVKELEETRVEIHHARNMDYKMALEDREALIRTLMNRVGHSEPAPVRF